MKSLLGYRLVRALATLKRLESDAAALNKSVDDILLNAEVTQHGLSSLRLLVAKLNSQEDIKREIRQSNRH